MLSENTCFHFFPLVLSAVSTAVVSDVIQLLTKLQRVDVC
jgi:hypothetical protein